MRDSHLPASAQPLLGQPVGLRLSIASARVALPGPIRVLLEERLDFSTGFASAGGRGAWRVAYGPVPPGPFPFTADPASRTLTLGEGLDALNAEGGLRLVVAIETVASGGLLLHASGLVRKGRTHVFLGPSGAGKSTVADLGDGTLLSDESVVVLPWGRSGRGGVRAHGTPFRSTAKKLPRNVKAEIAALFWLVQSKEDRAELLSPAAAATRLLEQAYRPDSAPATAFLKAARRIAEAVPMYDLHFTRSNRFLEVIDALPCAR